MFCRSTSVAGVRGDAEHLGARERSHLQRSDVVLLKCEPHVKLKTVCVMHTGLTIVARSPRGTSVGPGN